MFIFHVVHGFHKWLSDVNFMGGKGDQTPKHSLKTSLYFYVTLLEKFNYNNMNSKWMLFVTKVGRNDRTTFVFCMLNINSVFMKMYSFWKSSWSTSCGKALVWIWIPYFLKGFSLRTDLAKLNKIALIFLVINIRPLKFGAFFLIYPLMYVMCMGLAY